jgi:cell fate regulator YaaT (PSP1 superfamily)
MTDEEDPPPAPPPAPAARRPSQPVEMRLVAGVRLRPGGRAFACDTQGLPLEPGMRVVVEDDRGTDVGTVSLAPALRPVSSRLVRVLRIAEPRDLERAEAHERRAHDALAFARERVRARGLPIKMFHAELPGGGRAVLYFASDTRVDFRELVRDLAAQIRMRIELRQVGVRDEAKMIGGIGSCGRELCCSTFLPRFAPISIKSAKHQNLVLNPAKVSGQCGRLKCCLVYEEASYVEAAKKLPKQGKRVETPDGVGRVGDLDVLRGRIRVHFPDRPPKQYESHEVKAMPGGPPPAAPPPEGPDRGS